MLARTKLTDIKSGQEYLLFIAKMNLKGILVTSLPTLPVDNPVKLQLSLGSNQASIEISGAIYKIITSPQGTKGTIIRFVKVTESQEEKLKDFISQYESAIKKIIEKEDSPTPSIEKTSMIRETSLSHLSLSSPDRDTGSIASTMDEESIHQQQKGLSGHTIISHMKSTASSRDTKKFLRSLLILFIVLLSLIGWFYKDNLIAYLDHRFKTFHAQMPQEPAKQIPVAHQAKPGLSSQSLKSISIEQLESSLKVVLSGDGDFSKYYISKSSDPKRLILDFPEIIKIEAQQSVAVGKSPLLRIRSIEQNKGIRVYFDLYPDPFPKYALSPLPNSLEVTFRKAP